MWLRLIIQAITISTVILSDNYQELPLLCQTLYIINTDFGLSGAVLVLPSLYGALTLCSVIATIKGKMSSWGANEVSL